MQKYYDKTPTQGSTNPVRSDGLNQQLTQIGGASYILKAKIKYTTVGIPLNESN